MSYFFIKKIIAIMIGMKKGRVTVNDKIMYEMSFWARATSIAVENVVR
jgi:hypothetical protein